MQEHLAASLRVDSSAPSHPVVRDALLAVGHDEEVDAVQQGQFCGWTDPRTVFGGYLSAPSPLIAENCLAPP